MYGVAAGNQFFLARETHCMLQYRYLFLVNVCPDQIPLTLFASVVVKLKWGLFQKGGGEEEEIRLFCYTMS